MGLLNFSHDHGGIDPQELLRLGLNADKVLDFSVNSNPFGPPLSVIEAVQAVDISAYPDRECLRLRERLADLNQTNAEKILIGNGSVELIWMIAAAFLKPGDAVLIAAPTFGEYQRAAAAQGACVIEITAKPPHFLTRLDEVLAAAELNKARLIFLCNPNNPTGQYISDEEIHKFEKSIPVGCFLVLDEAYRTFVPEVALSHPHGEKTILLRSMTKDFALAGLRLGYALAQSGLIEQLKQYQPTWSVNALAQAAGCAALQELTYYQDTLNRLRELKKDLFLAIQTERYGVIPSDLHFGLVKTDKAAWKIREQLLRQAIQVRDCASFGLPQYIRVSTRLPAQNQKLVRALAHVRDII